MTSKSIELQIKAAVKVNMILFVGYLIFDYVRFSITGIPAGPIAYQISVWIGYAIWIFGLYVLVPYYIIKILKKLIASVI